MINLVNDGAEPVDIHAITPELPLGAATRVTKSSAAIDKTAEWIQLRDSLSDALWVLLLSSGELSSDVEDLQRRAVREERWLKYATVTFRMLPLTAIDIVLKSPAAQKLDQIRKQWQIDVRNSTDADRGLEVVRVLPRVTDTQRVLLQYKIAQMKDIEKELGIEYGSEPILAAIEPGGTYSQTLVAAFQRGWLDTRSYSPAFTVVYTDGQDRKSRSVTPEVTVTPSPWSLTVVAIAASLLGLLLRASVNPNVSFASSTKSLFTGGAVVAAVILALVVFNVIEYIHLKPFEGGFRPGWRTALLVGALCGLSSDHFVDGLRAFLGS